MQTTPHRDIFKFPNEGGTKMSTAEGQCSDASLMSTDADGELGTSEQVKSGDAAIDEDDDHSCSPSPSLTSMKSGSSAASKSSSMLRLNQQQQQLQDTWSDQAVMKIGSSDLRAPCGPSDQDDTDSELSDGENFLCKGAFLLTPSNELNMEKASAICEKMNFKGPFSLTKTATGILFKFAEPEDYQATFKKGFHKVTGARFYKKVPIPCRPQKAYIVFVLEVPEEVPEEDIRHSLYKFQSIVEVTRLPNTGIATSASGTSITSASGQPPSGVSASQKAIEKASSGASTSGNTSGSEAGTTAGPPPPIIRISVASLDEYTLLIQNGLDFYGATFFPTEPAINTGLIKAGGRKSTLLNRRNSVLEKKTNGNELAAINRARIPSRLLDVVGVSGHRVRDLLPVFDSAGFAKIPPPSSKTFKPTKVGGSYSQTSTYSLNARRHVLLAK